MTDTMTNIQIAPSVLSADFSKLGDELASIAHADYVHYDVMDGHFVPNISFGPALMAQAQKATDLPFDVHLMVTNPEDIVPLFLDLGAKIVTFHIEAATHAHRLVDLIHAHGAQAGISLNPATPVCLLENIIEDLDLALVMSVDPGFGGQKFIPGSLAKIRQLKRLCEAHKVHPQIEVDGGVSAANAAELTAAGATMLVAGSAIFKAEDRAAAIDELRLAAEKDLTTQA